MEWLLLWVGFAVVTAIAASSRGRSGGAWFFLGLLFGVFGLIAVLVMPRVEAPGQASVGALPNETKRRAELRQTAEAARAAEVAADTTACPQCAETIKKAAKICRFCQFDLEAWRAERASAT